MPSPNPYRFPTNLPEPEDDGLANHLEGINFPDLSFLLTDEGATFHPRSDSLQVVYFYPETGIVGKDPAPAWDSIPGAPGCTVQALGYRDFFNEFSDIGASIIGISGQARSEQRTFARTHSLPFLLLSDAEFALADMINLPTFRAGNRRFYKRIALVIRKGIIVKVFYPIFPPSQNASDVLEWLRSSSSLA
ncbi:MAG: peroxiredoxin [Pyrinomonadaceae bacterium]